MKTTRYYFILIALMAGCRIPKESSRETQKDSFYQSGLASHQTAWQFWDSSFRNWYYMTDTTFYFHPDSGLKANRGQLWSMTDERNGGFYNASSDTNFYESSDKEETLILEKSSSNRWIGDRIIALSLVTMMLLVGWFWYKK